ncbi:hypothetical protein PAXRUDRAFT_25019 [Paxillus rubicundulus Ve08.2h10]|uniref:Uncharacterized protein n=1 Tax=Paxillus rubicundulus Ve08.2h10 TaxID=930991 RepID=A0A0D0DSP7_9AGAM|nr:hypothetical protein PAXRUDRAFT_25019 [Paxillus rubicundulus Ve08.2h10]
MRGRLWRFPSKSFLPFLQRLSPNSVPINEDDFIKDHSPTMTQSSRSSGNSTLPDTSLATTIDLDDSPPRSFAAKLGELRSVPKHVDLRVPATAEWVFSPDLPCGDIVTVLEIGPARLHRAEQCRGVNISWLSCVSFSNFLLNWSTQQSFLSLGGKLRSPGKAGKGKDLRIGGLASLLLNTRPTHIVVEKASSLSATLEPSPPLHNAKQTSSNLRRSLRGTIDISWSPSAASHFPSFARHPNCCFQLAPISIPFSSYSPTWSCAKITRATANGKRRERMTQESMKALKKRLDSIDIDL